MLATAIALAILITLGVWQLQRHAWKTAMLAQVDAAEAAPPHSLTGDDPPLFTRVSVTGTLSPAPAALYGAEVQGERLGAQLVERLDRPGASPLVVVLGWVPTETARPIRVAGPATITGYVRLPEHPHWFTPPDDADTRRFYTLNPASIGAAIGAASPAPFVLVALGPPPAKPNAPIPAEALPRPPNNHLQYAFTWFGLAAALIGVVTAWLFQKEPRQPG